MRNLAKITLYLFIYLLGLRQYAFAIDLPPVFQYPLPEEGVPAFSQITAQLSRTPTVHAEFQQEKKISILKRPLISKGNFIFAANQGVIWNVFSPFASTVIITPRGLFRKEQQGAFSSLAPLDQPVVSGFTRAFLATFSGNEQDLSKHFQVFFEGQVSSWEIGLLPKEGLMRKAVAYLILKGASQIDRVTIGEENGDCTVVSLSKVKRSDQALPEAEQAEFPRSE